MFGFADCWGLGLYWGICFAGTSLLGINKNRSRGILKVIAGLVKSSSNLHQSSDSVGVIQQSVIVGVKD